jgi:hypothetical protein
VGDKSVARLVALDFTLPKRNITFGNSATRWMAMPEITVKKYRHARHQSWAFASCYAVHIAT